MWYSAGVPRPLAQPIRLAIAVAYAACLIPISAAVNGSFPPPFGLQGMWLYVAIMSFLLAAFLMEPHHTTPKDALQNASVVLLGVVAVDIAEARIDPEAAAFGRLALVVYCMVVLGLAAAAILGKGDRSEPVRLAAVATRLVGRLGRARFLFGLLFVLAAYAAFGVSGESIVLLLAALVLIAVRPLEELQAIWSDMLASPNLITAVVERLEDPMIVVARLPRGTVAKIGSVVRLGTRGDATGVVVQATTILGSPLIRIALDQPLSLSEGGKLTLTGDPPRVGVVGHVGDGTNLSELMLVSPAMAGPHSLSEGRLLDVAVGDASALYQVVDCEIVDKRDGELQRSTVRIRARKLGRWNETMHRFEPILWIPDPGSPVRAVTAAAGAVADTRFVGRVPGTSYGVELDVADAVTHNTAIIGMLGVGKTTLAWEIMKRYLMSGVKVLALDITGQYANKFRSHYPAAVETEHLTHIGAAATLTAFRAQARELLTRFVAGDSRLLVLNLPRLRTTNVGHADITQVVAETALEVLQLSTPIVPPSPTPRLCIVLEEAHSLIPEWSSVLSDREKAAVNGTARSLIQGRKYGLGCLVVAQRTANVTKSVLNQCSTVLAMRGYDATGEEFLKNYMGETYTRLLGSLQDRQAVLVGRASTCRSPVLLELNDEGLFDAQVWTPGSSGIPVTRLWNDLPAGLAAAGQPAPVVPSSD